MEGLNQHRTQWGSLVPSLVLCPAVLAIFVVLAPRLTWLYGSPGERALYAVMFVLPFVGVIGIVRFVRASRWMRWSAAFVYLATGALLVLFASVFVGCSLAKACL